MDYTGEASKVFAQHAKNTDEKGDAYLTVESFIDAVAPADAEDFSKIGRNSYGVLFDVADRNHKGQVNLRD